MTSCRCVRLRVDDAASATIRVNDPPAVAFGADEYAPYVPIMDDYEGPYQVTPTESVQVLETNTLHMDDDVTVEAIPSDYVGSAIDRRDATDLSAVGAIVSVPSGYYGSAAYKSVQAGAVPDVQLPSFDKDAGELRSKVTLGAGYQDGGTYTGSALALDTASGAIITPTTSEQTAVPQYRWTTGDVKVAAIPPEYVVPSGTYTVTGSGTHDVTQYASASVAAATPTNDSDNEYITSSGVRKWRYRPKTIVPTAGWAAQRSASNPINGFWQTFDAIPTGTTVTPTTSSQTIGGADTMLEGAVTVSAVPVGTEGTPSAAKSVSGHTATVTPSVTNMAGLIGGGTHTGTAVTVAASELVSGTKSISANGTNIDVTEYAAVDVAVPGSTPSLQAKTGIAPSTSSQTVTADAGYDGLSSVQIDAMPSGVVVPASSISTSGGAIITTETGKIVLTKTVSNVPQVTTAGYVTSGTFGDTSVTLRADCSINDSSSLTQSGNTVTAPAGYYPSAATLTVSGGGSVKFDTKTASGGSTYPTSLQFTSMKGEPKAFVLRLNAQVSSSGSTTYYYIVDIAAFGTTTHGNCFRIGSTRRVDNITSGYSWSYSGTTLTITSSAASRSASPGAFYNGSYELLYAY